MLHSYVFETGGFRRYGDDFCARDEVGSACPLPDADALLVWSGVPADVVLRAVGATGAKHVALTEESHELHSDRPHVFFACAGENDAIIDGVAPVLTLLLPKQAVTTELAHGARLAAIERRTTPLIARLRAAARNRRIVAIGHPPSAGVLLLDFILNEPRRRIDDAQKTAENECFGMLLVVGMVFVSLFARYYV